LEILTRPVTPASRPGKARWRRPVLPVLSTQVRMISREIMQLFHGPFPDLRREIVAYLCRENLLHSSPMACTENPGGAQDIS
jgi:hypothetical protein